MSAFAAALSRRGLAPTLDVQPRGRFARAPTPRPHLDGHAATGASHRRAASWGARRRMRMRSGRVSRPSHEARSSSNHRAPVAGARMRLRAACRAAGRLVAFVTRRPVTAPAPSTRPSPSTHPTVRITRPTRTRARPRAQRRSQRPIRPRGTSPTTSSSPWRGCRMPRAGAGTRAGSPTHSGYRSPNSPRCSACTCARYARRRTGPLPGIARLVRQRRRDGYGLHGRRFGPDEGVATPAAGATGPSHAARRAAHVTTSSRGGTVDRSSVAGRGRLTPTA